MKNSNEEQKCVHYSQGMLTFKTIHALHFFRKAVLRIRDIPGIDPDPKSADL
jgi:hypothetical protein